MLFRNLTFGTEHCLLLIEKEQQLCCKNGPISYHTLPRGLFVTYCNDSPISSFWTLLYFLNIEGTQQNPECQFNTNRVKFNTLKVSILVHPILS